MKKRADNRYRRKVTLPNGEVKYAYGKTQKEANEKRDKLKLMYALGATNIDRRITVQDWSEQWWEIIKEGKTGTSSQNTYISAMNNYIFPSMGNLKLIDVKPIHIQTMINQMGKAGKSKSLQHKVLLTCRGIFRYARKNGLIVADPSLDIELYEVQVKERIALFPAQTDKLLEICKGMRAELAIHLALFCGLRRGEIAALKWADVNEDYKMLVITHAVEYKHNRPNEKGTKSKSGNRIIPVPPELWTMLEDAKKVKKSLYVVTSANNEQLTESAMKRLIEPVQRRTQRLKEDSFHFTLHMLRHTYATNLDKMGVPDRTRQYLMGHSELSTTNIYTHIQDEHLDQASLMLAKLYRTSVTFSPVGVRMGSIQKQKP
jgi:integrase